jgi:hypothetical protein
VSMLAGVVSGQSNNGQRIVIAGAEKVGKTTLACDAPNSLLIPLEDGFASIRTPRLPNMLNTWEEVEALCLELLASAKSGRLPRGSSLVWDSATALERIIHAKVMSLDKLWKVGNPNGVTMESALEGYGKAYNVANDYFARWTRYMDELARYGGINCIVTCHVFAALVMDPAHGEYNTWDLQLHSPKNQKTYGKREFITQWADMIGFLHEPMFVMKAEKGANLQKGVSANQGRVIAVDRTPSWVAGNRYGLTGVIPLPDPKGAPSGAVWNQLAHAIYNSCGIDLFNRSST